MLPSYQSYQATSPEDSKLYRKMAIGEGPNEEEKRAINIAKSFYKVLMATVAGVTIIGIAFLSYRNYYNQTHSTLLTESSQAATTKSNPTSTSSQTTNTDLYPNIVFIYLDDLGYGSIGYNQYDLEGLSPFMTSLIKKGLFLTQYYAQEECTPS
jgi:hypothetical protein